MAQNQSSRGLLEVLDGEDTALPVMEASSTGDIATLQTMLGQSKWSRIMLESPKVIYAEHRSSQEKGDVRGVYAKETRNLNRAIIRAAEAGHAAAVSTLLIFASQHDIHPSSLIGHDVVKRTILRKQAAALEVLATANPAIATLDMGHGWRPLEYAMNTGDDEVVGVLVKLGAARTVTQRTEGSYRSSWLARAARFSGTHMTGLMLQDGLTVEGSGALHAAADWGSLGNVRLLLQHGADVNERLPPATLPMANRSLLASWTPSHFAASTGQVDVLEVLEREGAQTDVDDENGNFPRQLLRARE